MAKRNIMACLPVPRRVDQVYSIHKANETYHNAQYFQDLLAVRTFVPPQSIDSDCLPQPEEEDSQVSPDPKFLGLSFELVDLMNAFPFGLKDCPYTRYLFVPFLPSRERTMELADIYYKNVAWMCVLPT